MRCPQCGVEIGAGGLTAGLRRKLTHRAIAEHSELPRQHADDERRGSMEPNHFAEHVVADAPFQRTALPIHPSFIGAPSWAHANGRRQSRPSTDESSNDRKMCRSS